MLIARRGPIQRRVAALPLHPLLAAAYPVIFLFATNAAEQVTLSPLWLPLGMAVGGAAIALVVLRVVLRDWHRAALVTTALVIGFFGYGHVWNGVSERLDSQWPLIGAWGLLILIGVHSAWRLRGWARAATPVLNLVAGLLLLLNGWGLTQAVVALGASRPVEAEASSLELHPVGDLPDVYYVILDRYAGSAALAEVYDFDNEPFLTALEDRGFRVARDARANYIKTPLSLVSSLNMEFLDAEELKAEQDSGRDRGPIHRDLRERLVVPAALKALGYQYLQVANWWAPTSGNVDADRVFRYAGQDEFSTVLAQTTLLRAINDPQEAAREPFARDVLYDSTAYALDTLDESADIPGPKYVFAHLLIPHDPYVFDTDGSFMDRRQVEEQGREASYLRQLQYANSRMLRLVDRIIERSGEDAVILLQADEGPFPARYSADEWGFLWRTATQEELEEKFGILFAMRVPGADIDAAGFHDGITPVNAWRVIFNARFGADLPLLPDRTWAHASLYRFFDFLEITDRLN